LAPLPREGCERVGLRQVEQCGPALPEAVPRTRPAASLSQVEPWLRVACVMHQGCPPALPLLGPQRIDTRNRIVRLWQPNSGTHHFIRIPYGHGHGSIRTPRRPVTGVKRRPVADAAAKYTVAEQQRIDDALSRAKSSRRSGCSMRTPVFTSYKHASDQGGLTPLGKSWLRSEGSHWRHRSHASERLPSGRQHVPEAKPAFRAPANTTDSGSLQSSSTGLRTKMSGSIQMTR